MRSSSAAVGRVPRWAVKDRQIEKECGLRERMTGVKRKTAKNQRETQARMKEGRARRRLK